MADLISTQGVWASGVRGLPQEMSGIFLRHSSIGMVILVNYGHPRCRKRFSYAHEYAHALLDRKTTSAIVEQPGELAGFHRASGKRLRRGIPDAGRRREVVPRRGAWKRGGRAAATASPTGRQVDEPDEAEERPAPGSQQITYQDVVTFAHHFGVSYPAAVYRLSDLRFHERRREGKHSRENRTSPPDSSGRWTISTTATRRRRATTETRPGTRQPNRPARHRGIPPRGGFSGVASGPE